MVREEYILLTTGEEANRSTIRIITASPRLTAWAGGSLKEKCRANLAAIRLVRKLQSENRNPTNEEKSALVRYVGWGGLPQVFSPATDWQAENVELASLLSEDEFRAARATTLNAHYSAGAVVKGMYASALERLGFNHGRVFWNRPVASVILSALCRRPMLSRSTVTGTLRLTR